MYLLYVDESGPLDRPETSHVVIGGLAVHESDVRQLVRSTEAVVAKHLDGHLRATEIHTQRIRKGAGVWRGIPETVKRALLAELGTLLST